MTLDCRRLPCLLAVLLIAFLRASLGAQAGGGQPTGTPPAPPPGATPPAGGQSGAPPAPILLGRHLLDLGVTPGPAMGVILKQAYERQLDNEFTDLDGALAFARTRLSST